MAVVNVFKTMSGHAAWQHVASFLDASGVGVYCEPCDGDVSIVLGGKNDNPSAFSGKKILAYDEPEWNPIGFPFYKRVLDEYYDDFINLTGKNVQARTDAIIKYIRGINV